MSTPVGTPNPPVSAVDLIPLLIDRASGQELLVQDVQSVSLHTHENDVCGAKVVRLLTATSDPFPWIDRCFDLYLINHHDLNDYFARTWTTGIGIRGARFRRSKIVADIKDGEVKEVLWLKGDAVVYLDGEPWQRLMLRRFPLIP